MDATEYRLRALISNLEERVERLEEFRERHLDPDYSDYQHEAS